MYIQKSFKNKNIEELHQLIENFNFATVITFSNNEPQVSHIPVMLDRKSGQYGTLIGHVAKLNTHSTLFDGKKSALCIFHGPHAYISHTWYKHSPRVPTWNYAVVHAYGSPVISSKEQLSDDLSLMLDHHEAMLNEKSDYTIPDEFKIKLMDSIVGFRMKILRIEGKFKLGQNLLHEDREGMLQGLRKQNSYETTAMADFIQSNQKRNYQTG